MLYYNGIDSSEGINSNKKTSSKVLNIYDYWYFPDKEFKF